MTQSTRGRQDTRFCRSGEHAWVPSNIYRWRNHLYCRECRLLVKRAWRRKNYKHTRTSVGAICFNVDSGRIKKLLDLVFNKCMSIRAAAKESGLSYWVGRKIYWAERDRRMMAARVA